MTVKLFFSVFVASGLCFALLLAAPLLFAPKQPVAPLVKPLHYSTTFEHGRVLYPGLPRLDQMEHIW